MLINTILKETLSLQGFRIISTSKIQDGIQIRLAPDLRYRPLCGRCKKQGQFRDIRPQRMFKHVPLWNLSVELIYSPRRVSCHDCSGVYVEYMPWSAEKRREPGCIGNRIPP